MFFLRLRDIHCAALFFQRIDINVFFGISFIIHIDLVQQFFHHTQRLCSTVLLLYTMILFNISFIGSNGLVRRFETCTQTFDSRHKKHFVAIGKRHGRSHDGLYIFAVRFCFSLFSFLFSNFLSIFIRGVQQIQAKIQA